MNRETEALYQGYLHTIPLLNLTWYYLSRSLRESTKLAELKSSSYIMSLVTIRELHWRNNFITVFNFIPLAIYSFRSMLFEVRDPKVSATWDYGTAQEKSKIFKASLIYLHCFLSKVRHEFCLTETGLELLNNYFSLLE